MRRTLCLLGVAALFGACKEASPVDSGEPVVVDETCEHEVVVTQFGEVTRITDTDKDGVADRFYTLGNKWGYAEGHEFAFGSKPDPEGTVAIRVNWRSNELRQVRLTSLPSGVLLSVIPIWSSDIETIGRSIQMPIYRTGTHRRERKAIPTFPSIQKGSDTTTWFNTLRIPAVRAT